MNSDLAKNFPLAKFDLKHPKPVVVSIPHYGIAELPEDDRVTYARQQYKHFPLGYSDAFARYVYCDWLQWKADVIATPFSRLFVDVNRRRDDFAIVGDVVESRKGVFRTHSVDGESIFSTPLYREDAERWLSRYYDPYHGMLREFLSASTACYGKVCLIDAHTGSPNGMKSHEVVLGTAHGQTANSHLARIAGAVFRDAGFQVSLEVKGYSGGYTVKQYGQLADTATHAIQLELNANLFFKGSRHDYIESLMTGGMPAVNQEALDRARSCVSTLIDAYHDVIFSSDL